MKERLRETKSQHLARQGGKVMLFLNIVRINLVCDALIVLQACNDDEDNIEASVSDMAMNSADENAEMQELCDEVCSDYLPECGGYSGSESESESGNY